MRFFTRILLLSLVCVASLLAQRDLGTITGTISDAQGAAVPGARVTLSEDSTGLKYTVETNASGEYTRPALKRGNLGMQSNSGPGQFNVDFSMFKGFSLTERFKVQLRAEGFNIFNHPQFGTPDNNTYDGNFGRVSSTLFGSERRIQLALRFQF